MYQRILIPVDGSPTSDRGLQEAIRLGKLTSASLRLLHVVDMLTYGSGLDIYDANAGDVLSATREAGERILARGRATGEAAGLRTETLLVERPSGSVADHVAAQAREWEADLVVLGTHGRRGMSRFLLGSDAEEILRSSPVPVLLVRGDEATDEAVPSRDALAAAPRG